MKNPSIASAVAVVLVAGCAIVAFQLWQRSQQSAAQRAPVSDPQASPRIAEPAPVMPVPDLPPAPVTPPITMPAPSPQTVAAAPAADVVENAAKTLTIEFSSADDPRVRKQLDDLPSWLYLHEDMKDRLAPVLAAKLISGVSMRGGVARDGMEELEKSVQQRWTEVDARIEQLLGTHQYALWKEYEDSATARRYLAALDSGSAAAIPEHTVRKMAVAMTRAEQKADPGWKKGTTLGLLGSAGLTRLDAVDAQLETYRRKEELMLEAAMPYLSEAQLEKYDKERQARVVQQESNTEMSKARILAMEARAREAAAGGNPPFPQPNQ